MLFSWLALKGHGRPEVERIEGLRIAGLYAARACMYPTLRRNTRVRRWGRRRRKVVRRYGQPLRIARKCARTTRKDLRRLRRRSVRGARSAAKSLAAPVLGGSNRK
jgi:hypothetical protein